MPKIWPNLLLLVLELLKGKIVIMQKKRYNFETKKSVHINLTLGTHAAFRQKLFSKGLSMQEVLEECAIRVANDESYMEKLLDTLVKRKIDGERKIAASDAASIYRLIEDEDE